MQIRAKNIVKIFNKKLPTELKALNNVSVEIKENEFIAIIGQTGSGKTTFIEHMNVLLTPDEGEVEFVYKAKDPKTQEVEVIKNIIQKPKSFQKKLKFIKEIRRRVGVVFQFAEYQLFEQTIEKDIIFGAVSMGTPKAEAKERAKEIIKLVGLDESYLPKSPFNLSGGQKRRVAIAGILAMGKNNLIGKGDDLPWYVKEDFDFYREQTKHHDILVGKNTFFTLPKSLQKWSKIYIVSDDKNFNYENENVKTINNFSNLIKEYQNHPSKHLFVSGGYTLYKSIINKCDQLIISFIKGEHSGDIFLNELKWEKFEEISSKDKGKFIVKKYKKTK